MLDPYANPRPRKIKPKSTVKSDCATARKTQREQLPARVAGRASIGAGGEEFLLDNFGEDVAEQDVAFLNARSIAGRHA